MTTSVVVTGASGFVGQHLCTDLTAAGHDVRAAVRHRSCAGSIEASAEIAVVSNPESPSDWRKAVQGANTVIHLIARTHSTRADFNQLEVYRQVNVGITEALLEGCALGGVRRFVYLSSIKAVGEGVSVPYDESAPCRPKDAYGRTKLEAETLISRASAETGIEAAILRAPLIYGPGVKGNFLEILKLVERRCPFPIGGVHNARSMIFVGNLANAIVSLLEREGFPESLFHVADPGPPLSTQDLVRELAHLMGRKVVVFPVPQALLRLGGRLLGRQDLVSRLTGSLTVSAERIQRALGWHAPFSVSEGLSRTVDWYLAGSRGGKR